MSLEQLARDVGRLERENTDLRAKLESHKGLTLTAVRQVEDLTAKLERVREILNDDSGWQDKLHKIRAAIKGKS